MNIFLIAIYMFYAILAFLLYAKNLRRLKMSTGKKAASLAGKELRDKKASKSERAVAGSDLSQAKKKKSGKKK